jgi:hypothetical protein
MGYRIRPEKDKRWVTILYPHNNTEHEMDIHLEYESYRYGEDADGNRGEDRLSRTIHTIECSTLSSDYWDEETIEDILDREELGFSEPTASPYDRLEDKE